MPPCRVLLSQVAVSLRKRCLVELLLGLHLALPLTNARDLIELAQHGLEFSIDEVGRPLESDLMTQYLQIQLVEGIEGVSLCGRVQTC